MWRTISRVFGFAGVLLLAVPTSGRAQSFYSVESFGVPGFFTTQPLDINDSGEVVGVASSPGPPRGFLTDLDSYTVFLYPGALYTSIRANNNLGQFAGVFFVPPSPPQGLVRGAFLSDGTNSALGAGRSAASSAARPAASPGLRS